MSCVGSKIYTGIAFCVAVSFGFSVNCAPAVSRPRMPPPEPSSEAWISQKSIAELTRAIDMYRKIAAQGAWPKLPDRVILRPGDSSNDVALLRRRLEMTGDIGPSSRDKYLFDGNLKGAVKRYQLRNGLEPTGIVYGITQRLLNVSVKTRIKQLELNLERLRDLVPKLTSQKKYIVMNAAAFALQGVKDGRVEVTSRTIAGKRATPTPFIQAKLRAINTLPYWHVPRSIANAQVIPSARKDPAYLSKEKIRVYSSFGGEEIDPSTINWWGPEAGRYVFRQDPGPQNALGLLRFDMPNKHTVYMHDTPMKQLFNRFERAYSSGCVRMQNYLSVADWLLEADAVWNAETIKAEITRGSRKTINLANPVPVFFIYLTAWVDGGVVNFRNDLYNLDNSAFDTGKDIASQRFNSILAP